MPLRIYPPKSWFFARANALPRWQRLGGMLLALSLLPMLSHCATTPPMKPHLAQLDPPRFVSSDGEEFPIAHWLSENTQAAEAEIVLIGLHGISGASSDYAPLATSRLARERHLAIYAPELRGQGRDPVIERRGHISHPQEWFNDLYTLTALARQKHPKAKVIWCGESMGSLIALHAYHAYPGDTPPCDALILASPIAGIKRNVPAWKENTLHFAAILFPKARLSLQSLSDEKVVHVTRDEVHHEQVKKNDYHIDAHTLRLLSTLGKMARKLPRASQSLAVPTLILHGGKDIFTDADQVAAFAKNLPTTANGTYLLFPESHHLLFHDQESAKVVSDLVHWIDDLEEHTALSQVNVPKAKASPTDD